MTTTTVDKHDDRPDRHRGRDTVQFRVDGERYTTEEETLTANEIIRDFAKLDPSTHYLVQINGPHERVSYEGRGEASIRMRDGLRFQVIATGPTPVSDGRQ